jgi:PAS domain S-box-containing protein
LAPRRGRDPAEVDREGARLRIVVGLAHPAEGRVGSRRSLGARERGVGAVQAIAQRVVERLVAVQVEQQGQGLLVALQGFAEAAALEEHGREGIVLLTPALQIIRMNQVAEMILGYASHEVKGQPVEKVLIGPETLSPAMSSAQQGSPTYNLGSVRLYRRDGDDFLALVRVFPVMKLVVAFSLATGAIIGFVKGTLHDAERTLFKNLWDLFEPGDVLLADSAFCSYADFYFLSQRGIDCLMAKHHRRTKGLQFVKSLGKQDRLLFWIKMKPCPTWLRKSHGRRCRTNS